MLDSRLVMIRCPIGGIGRRARLKIEFRKKCWFDSGMGHHNTHDQLNYMVNYEYNWLWQSE